ncbi:uncharacterized protein [Euphorbia lathyris]|uniref:uncharacterized protein n=1 Tax=Euphorbia lathyris TaxID=212925 RepID=UPI0033132B61
MEMEAKTPEVAKKLWHIVRVVFFMLRKGISKSKIMEDFNLMFKRGNKLAGKAIAVEASPMVFPGFGKSPMVRQLRITDSPFPLKDDGDTQVDVAAEAFIKKFYKDLKSQKNTYAAFESPSPYHILGEEERGRGRGKIGVLWESHTKKSRYVRVL